MRAAKVDGNQPAIVKALRAAGASVQHLHEVGQGCPDLLVGFRNRNWLIECKVPAGKLTEDQEDWHRDWAGQVAICHSPHDALEAIGATGGQPRNYKDTARWKKSLRLPEVPD